MANNGDEGLQHVKEGRYDIVFVDIQMPKMDGWNYFAIYEALDPSCRWSC